MKQQLGETPRMMERSYDKLKIFVFIQAAGLKQHRWIYKFLRRLYLNGDDISNCSCVCLSMVLMNLQLTLQQVYYFWINQSKQFQQKLSLIHI